MPNITKTQLKALISQGDVEKAIKIIQDVTKDDNNLNSQIIHLSARFHSNKKNELQGLSSDANIKLENNRITSSLVQIANQLPDNVNTTVPVGSIIYGDGNGNTPVSPSEDAHSNPTPAPSAGKITPLAWLGVLLLLICLGLTMYFDCLEGNKFLTVRIILSLGAACLASVIPGLFNANFLDNRITAGGALAFGAFVFLFNPAGSLESENGCKEDFNFTANLQIESPSNQYPKLDKTKAKLELFIKNEWKSTSITPSSLADFKNINSQYEGTKVKARLTTLHWTLESDSILLKDGSSDLKIVPDGSLSKVSGRVIDETGNPIEGVTIDLGAPSRMVISDANGYFTVNIAEEDQRLRHNLTARKTDYQTFSYEYIVQEGESAEIILMK
ncbi:MAG: carboxypeptidase regulatory-like domain-containing protein [Bacteroidota bacterium]